jgi:ADP-ribose pyrophosphatase
MTLYLATDLSPVVEELPQDDDEKIDLIYVDYEQATALFNNGQLKDAKTNMAYLYWRTLQ